MCCRYSATMDGRLHTWVTVCMSVAQPQARHSRRALPRMTCLFLFVAARYKLCPHTLRQVSSLKGDELSVAVALVEMCCRQSRAA
jgi:hypothetical protein